MKALKGGLAGYFYGALSGFFGDLYFADTLAHDSWRPVTSLLVGFFNGIIGFIVFSVIAGFIARRASRTVLAASAAAWSAGLFAGEHFVGQDMFRHLLLPAVLAAIASIAAGFGFSIGLKGNVGEPGSATLIKQEVLPKPSLEPAEETQGRSDYLVGIAIVVGFAVLSALAGTYLSPEGKTFDPYETLVLAPVNALSAGVSASIVLRVFNRNQRRGPTSIALGSAWLIASVLSALCSQMLPIGSGAIILTPELFPFAIGPLSLFAASWCLASLQPKRL